MLKSVDMTLHCTVGIGQLSPFLVTLTLAVGLTEFAFGDPPDVLLESRVMERFARFGQAIPFIQKGNDGFLTRH